MAGVNTGFAGQATAAAHVEGLLSWWALAGVEGGVAEESVDWLRPVAARPAAPAAVDIPGKTFPDGLVEFESYLAASPDVPERRWPGRRIMPAGPAMARLMVVVPAPEGDSALLDEKAQRLMTRILAAIGLAPTEVYCAALSLVAPPGGRIEADMLETLAIRMRHHIGLVAPAAVLLAGDQTRRALMPTGGAGDEENLPMVNHSGGKLRTAMVHHPRLLMQQPSAKAEAWRTLARLAKVWAQ